MTPIPEFQQALEKLTRLVNIYAEATGYEPTTILRLVCGDANVLKRFEDGSVTLSLVERLFGHFSALWLDRVPWPDDIPRPDPVLVSRQRGRPRTRSEG